MGKVRRQRQKLHLASSKSLDRDDKIKPSLSSVPEDLPLLPPTDNIFAGIKMDINSILTPSLTCTNDIDDNKSVKSMKSVASSKVQTNKLSKKDKLKLRREVFLKKIDTVNQMKKELKIREKRTKIPILGDTNPLLDALPTLDLLVKDKPERKKAKHHTKKAIAKASRRKRELVQGVNMFKTILNDKEFKKNPLEAVTKQIQVRFSKPAKTNAGNPSKNKLEKK